MHHLSESESTECLSFPMVTGPATSLVAAAAAALSSLVAQNQNAQDAARNVGALQKLLRWDTCAVPLKSSY